MPFPTKADYQEAIRNSSKLIHVSSLRRGVAATVDSFGNPGLRSGQFAVVFEYVASGKHWALKCFTADIGDSARIYREVDTYLRSARLPYFIDFSFHQRGITVRGEIHPLLQMEWKSAPLLGDFLGSSLTQPRRIGDLAASWRVMVGKLRGAHIDHGDLQQGNIKVEAGASGTLITLIDYDSMVIPSLVGMPQVTTGLPGFQHPRRSALTKLVEGIDGFSQVVLYATFRALEADPGLWARCDAALNDEGLLFTGDDFRAPRASPRLADVVRLGGEAGRLASWIVHCCLNSDPLDVPSIDDCLARDPPKRAMLSMPFATAGPGTQSPARPASATSPWSPYSRPAVAPQQPTPRRTAAWPSPTRVPASRGRILPVGLALFSAVAAGFVAFRLGFVFPASPSFGAIFDWLGVSQAGFLGWVTATSGMNAPDHSIGAALMALVLLFVVGIVALVWDLVWLLCTVVLWTILAGLGLGRDYGVIAAAMGLLVAWWGIRQANWPAPRRTVAIQGALILAAIGVGLAGTSPDPARAGVEPETSVPTATPSATPIEHLQIVTIERKNDVVLRHSPDVSSGPPLTEGCEVVPLGPRKTLNGVLFTQVEAACLPGRPRGWVKQKYICRAADEAACRRALSE